MKGRAIIPLVIGLGVGVLAIKSFVGVLQKAKGSTGQVETVELIRADVDIAPAVAITEDMIESVEVPKKMAPTGAYCDRQKVIGRVTKTAIPAGVPVMESLLSPEGTIPGLASMVREGFRAMALQVDEIVGVAGWLKPGCRVDVNLCMSQGRGTSISKVILQNVEVLAVGQTYQAEGSKAAVTRSVTVLVKPEEASRLHLATTKGRLQLAMRNGADYSEPRPATVTTADLLRTSASGKNDGESQEQSSLLGSFFAKLPKIVKEQTDKKEPKPVPSVTPVASLAAAQPAPQP